MLSGINPILSGALLAALDRLGHGDEFAIVDANYPAYQVGVNVVDAPGLTAATVVEAVRTVVPLDTHEGASVILMSGEGDDVRAMQGELLDAADVEADRVDELERFEFYDRVTGAQLVVRTGELRSYGNLIMRRGVINHWESPGSA